MPGSLPLGLLSIFYPQLCPDRSHPGPPWLSSFLFSEFAWCLEPSWGTWRGKTVLWAVPMAGTGIHGFLFLCQSVLLMPHDPSASALAFLILQWTGVRQDRLGFAVTRSNLSVADYNRHFFPMIYTKRWSAREFCSCCSEMQTEASPFWYLLLPPLKQERWCFKPRSDYQRPVWEWRLSPLVISHWPKHVTWPAYVPSGLGTQPYHQSGRKGGLEYLWMFPRSYDRWL